MSVDIESTAHTQFIITRTKGDFLHLLAVPCSFIASYLLARSLASFSLFSLSEVRAQLKEEEEEEEKTVQV